MSAGEAGTAEARAAYWQAELDEVVDEAAGMAETMGVVAIRLRQLASSEDLADLPASITLIHLAEALEGDDRAACEDCADADDNPHPQH